jgi:hypothetical protein
MLSVELRHKKLIINITVVKRMKRRLFTNGIKQTDLVSGYGDDSCGLYGTASFRRAGEAGISGKPDTT